jgi:hypothetical protein
MRCFPDVVIRAAIEKLRSRVHHSLKHVNAPRRKAHMTEQDEKRRESEQHLTDELVNQAKQEPGSAAEAESKEKRAQAEKEFQDAR